MDAVGGDMHDHHDHSAGGAAIAAEDKAICPVMHEAVSKKVAEQQGLVRSYKGKDFYLCCSSCATSFDNNPDKYTSVDDSQ